MAKRSTRRRILDAANGAHENLKGAQKQLVSIARMADDRSEYIDRDLPLIITGLETVIDAVDKFSEKL